MSIRTSRTRYLLLSALAGLALSACGGELTDEGDPGEEPGTADDVPAAMQTLCTRAHVLQQTPAGARRRMIDRAFHWVDARVMYSQTKYFEGYRQDCSGFVSMAWELGQSRTTAGFAPYDTAVSGAIGSAALTSGDALNKEPRGHIMLFAGWADQKAGLACVLQESQTGTPASLGARSIKGFHPIRKR